MDSHHSLPAAAADPVLERPAGRSACSKRNNASTADHASGFSTSCHSA